MRVLGDGGAEGVRVNAGRCLCLEGYRIVGGVGGEGHTGMQAGERYTAEEQANTAMIAAAVGLIGLSRLQM